MFKTDKKALNEFIYTYLDIYVSDNNCLVISFKNKNDDYFKEILGEIEEILLNKLDREELLKACPELVKDIELKQDQRTIKSIDGIRKYSSINNIENRLVIKIYNIYNSFIIKIIIIFKNKFILFRSYIIKLAIFVKI